MTHPDHILPQPAQMTQPDYLYSPGPLFFNLFSFKKTFLVAQPAPLEYTVDTLVMHSVRSL